MSSSWEENKATIKDSKGRSLIVSEKRGPTHFNEIAVACGSQIPTCVCVARFTVYFPKGCSKFLKSRVNFIRLHFSCEHK